MELLGITDHFRIATSHGLARVLMDTGIATGLGVVGDLIGSEKHRSAASSAALPAKRHLSRPDRANASTACCVAARRTDAKPARRDHWEQPLSVSGLQLGSVLSSTIVPAEFSKVPSPATISSSSAVSARVSYQYQPNCPATRHK